MLFASGWTLDDVLNLSWQQLHVVSRCVVAYKAEQANMILQVVTSALGGKVKRPSKARAERPAQQQRTAGQGSVDTATRFAAMGFPVETVG
jgi:hypothetical protein